jgi:ribosomal protein L40E
MSEPDQNTAPKTKVCSSCAEQIPKAAVKCRFCGSYQTWRGRLAGGAATILALLVALISVIRSSAPIVVGLLRPKTAAFTLSPPTFREGAVSVTASNIGSLPARLSDAAIMIPQKRGAQPYIFILDADGTATDQTVGPGDAKILTFKFDAKKYDPPHLTAQDAPCTLEIFESIREVSCDEIRFMTAKHARPSERSGLLPEEVAPLDHPARWK